MRNIYNAIRTILATSHEMRSMLGQGDPTLSSGDEVALTVFHLVGTLGNWVPSPCVDLMERTMATTGSPDATFIVPATLAIMGLEPSRLQAHRTHFQESRSLLLAGLHSAPGFTRAFAQLAPTGLYRLLPGPAGTWMVRDKATGAIQSVWRDARGISQEGRLQRAGPNLRGALAAIASQVLLVKIAVDIQTVIRQNVEISQSLHADRVTLITSGAAVLDQAIRTCNPSTRQSLLCNAIQTLNQGIHGCCREMASEITKAPSSNSFLDNFWKSNASRSSERFQKAEESLHASIFGSQCLAQAYALLDEPQASVHAMSSVLELILSSGTSEACSKARFLPRTNGQFPEETWKVVRCEGQKYLEQVRIFERALDATESLGIEVHANELLENSHGTRP